MRYTYVYINVQDAESKMVEILWKVFLGFIFFIFCTEKKVSSKQALVKRIHIYILSVVVHTQRKKDVG